MKTVTVSAYVEKVNAIYKEQPTYETGHDGSDGKCDCIGMCRGALKRAGATDVKGMNGTNYAARYTVNNLEKIESVNALCVGDLVFKTRSIDDASMPLPDRYRKGGGDYNGDLTNYTHIGTVTKTNPLEITHMTTPTAQKDTKLGKWEFVATLPWVDGGTAPEPEPEPEPIPEPDEPETAVVVAESGRTVKMRAKPSTKCRIYWDVPIGSEVIVDKIDGNWTQITYADRMGWMMTKFLCFDHETIAGFTVHVPNLSEGQAQKLAAKYPGAWITQ